MIRINLMPGDEHRPVDTPVGGSLNGGGTPVPPSGGDHGPDQGAEGRAPGRARSRGRVWFLLIFFILICVEAGALLYVQRAWQGELVQLEAVNSAAYERIGALEEQVADVPLISQKMDQLRAVDTGFQDHQALKGNGVRLLEEVAFVFQGGEDRAGAAPGSSRGSKNKARQFVVLTKLRIDHGEVFLEGVADDIDRVVSVVNRMKNSPLWAGVTLNFLQGAGAYMPGREDVVRFSISCHSPLAFCAARPLAPGGSGGGGVGVGAKSGQGSGRGLGVGGQE